MCVWVYVYGCMYPHRRNPPPPPTPPTHTQPTKPKHHKHKTKSKKQLYESWDAWAGPWVCRRFVALRSVFVKFGQYVGGRSDMVPPAWAAALSLLQVRVRCLDDR